ncbi:MAG: replication protein [Deltaproteobacteria bacterium]|nr:replication protein [Deltaproteobacteria bacterium]
MKRTGHPRREDGFTTIFNELLEALMCADIPKRARRLIDVQMRFSFGCGPRSFTSLTTKDFAGLADLDWSNAHRAIIWLVEKGIFERDPDCPGRYRLNKLYHCWEVRVPLRDDPGYTEMLKRTVRRSVDSTDEPVKTTDASVEMTDGMPVDSRAGCQNDRGPSVETTDGELSKRQMTCADSSSMSKRYDGRKNRLKKGKEKKEFGSRYADQEPAVPLAGPSPVPDDHPFFDRLSGDLAFWNALAAAYHEQDIPAQILRMTAWLMANPKRRPKDYKRFIQGWLAREERKESAHGRPYPDPPRRDQRDSEEEPPPFSDFPPELVIR